MKSRDYGTHAGTGAYEGMFWNGREWIGEPTDAARAARAASGTPLLNPERDPVARRLAGILYALIGVLVAVAATQAIPLFGTAGGGLFLVVGLLVAAIFGIVALTKL